MSRWPIPRSYFLCAYVYSSRTPIAILHEFGYFQPRTPNAECRYAPTIATNQRIDKIFLVLFRLSLDRPEKRDVIIRYSSSLGNNFHLTKCPSSRGGTDEGFGLTWEVA